MQEWAEALEECLAKAERYLNMPKHGSRPDMKRRRRMARLWAKGLTLEAIGRRLGISRQCVQQTLRTARTARAFTCCRCKTVVAMGTVSVWLAGPLLCRSCAAQGHKATFGQRLKAFRVTAGLTQSELGEKTGLHVQQVSTYERDEVQPRARTLAKLSSALGVRGW